MVGGDPVAPYELQAVIQIGGCSAVLVAPDRVLTCGHCIAQPPTEVFIGGAPVRVEGCRSHPRFASGESAHDLAVCILAAPQPVRPIEIGLFPIAAGAEVRLAGYGQRGPFDRALPALRSTTTSVIRADTATLIVGTATRTACMGDSGGPVLVRTDGQLRVVALLQGSTGALCHSPTVAALLSDDDGWLGVAEVAPALRSAVGSLVVVAIGLTLVALTVRSAVSRWGSDHGAGR